MFILGACGYLFPMTNKNDDSCDDKVHLSKDDKVNSVRVGFHLQTIKCLGLRDFFLLVTRKIFRGPRTFFMRFVLELHVTLQRSS